MDFSVISPCLGKAKVFAVNSNQTNLVKIQCLDKNIKLIICISDGLYTLFTKTFMLFLYYAISVLKCFIYRQVKKSKNLHGAKIPVTPTTK